MILNVAATIAGLLVLAKASDHFVVGAARVSLALRVSPIVVGAIVVGFGTSAPELLVSSLAANQGDLDLGVGNVIGSNAANLTLVLGVAAMVLPITVASGVIRREAPLSVGAVVMFAVLAQDGFTRSEGLVMLGALVVALVVVVVGNDPADALGSDIGDLHTDHPDLRTESLRVALGLTGTVVGAQGLVWGATGVADELGLSGGFVGFSLVAIGTSLPELVTALAAARRGETDLIVGNLLGSNIFNSLAVGGAIALIGPGPLTDSRLEGFGNLAMVMIAALAMVLMITRARITRIEGVLLLIVYLVCLVVLSGGDTDDDDERSLAAPDRDQYLESPAEGRTDDGRTGDGRPGIAAFSS
ncbi:MAG: calcium/sodium antiporter [Actinomycetia bacterium]|nr:calcium/sodium antiporter [Actinomycetes bacterium]